MEFGGFEAFLREALGGEATARIAGGALGAIILGVLGLAARWFWKRLKTNWNWRDRAVAAEKRIAQAVRAVEGDSLWLKRPIDMPGNYSLRMQSSIPILTLANLKGGVGKTTLAANLAAYFAIARNERVLAIDLDFQGSLTSMTLPQQYGAPRSRAWHLVRGDGLMPMIAAQPVVLPVVAHDGRGQPHGHRGFLKAIDAYFDVAEAETEVLVKWLVGAQSRDIRYFLAETLLSDEVQKNFHRVIIDAPPRMTTSAIQAFCASTHVLIPTILDQLSGVAVASLCDSLVRHRELWPHLKILGVAGVLTSQDVGAGRSLTPQEREGIESVQGALLGVQSAHNLNALPTNLLPQETFIASRAEFKHHAGQRILYAQDGNAPALQQARQMIERLGGEVARRM